MKLLLILSKTFFLGLAMCGGLAIPLAAVLEAWVAGAIAFLTIFTVFLSFLAMSVTMMGRHPLWQVVSVLEIGIASAFLQVGKGVTLDLTIFGIVCFGVSSIPFLVICAFGFALADTDRPFKMEYDVADALPHWRLSAIFSSVTAIALLLGSTQLLFHSISARTIDDVVFNLEWTALITFVSVACPLAMIATTSTSIAATRSVQGCLLITLSVGISVFRSLGDEWISIAVLVGVPSFLFVLASYGLWRNGFRLVPKDSVSSPESDGD